MATREDASADTADMAANKSAKLTRPIGPILLLCAALVWGMAFVAQSKAADSIGPFTFNGTRTLLAAVVLFIVIRIRDAARDRGAGDNARADVVAKRELVRTKNSAHRGDLRHIILAGIACGVALFFADCMQQSGITAYPDGVASAGRSGFITATYVVMVALVSWIRSRHIQPATAAAVVICIVGMYLLCFSGGISQVYVGDLLVLLSAVGYTAHILVIDRYTDLDPIKLTCAQFFTSGTIAFVCMLLFEHPSISSVLSAAVPILYAALFSSCLGYTFQTIGQRYTEPSVAAIVMSLESVFSAIGGALILGEVLSPRELIGCTLVFTAVILAQVPEFLKGLGQKR